MGYSRNSSAISCYLRRIPVQITPACYKETRGRKASVAATAQKASHNRVQVIYWIIAQEPRQRCAICHVASPDNRGKDAMPVVFQVGGGCWRGTFCGDESNLSGSWLPMSLLLRCRGFKVLGFGFGAQGVGFGWGTPKMFPSPGRTRAARPNHLRVASHVLLLR